MTASPSHSRQPGIAAGAPPALEASDGLAPSAVPTTGGALRSLPPALVGLGAALTWEQCAEQGMTAREAAAAMGKTVDSARFYASRHGVKFAGRRAPANATGLTYEACAAAGMTIPEAARAMGRSEPAVREYGEKHGLTFRPAPLAKERMRLSHANLTAGQYEDFLTYRRFGASLREALDKATAPKRRITWKAPK